MRTAKPLVHGTITAYYSYGCRCDVCKAGAREYERARAGRKKELLLAKRARQKELVSAPYVTLAEPGFDLLQREAFPVELVVRMKPQHPHAHRWQLDAPKGMTIRQCCRGCGRVKYVSSDPGANLSAAKRGRPRKVAA